MKLELLNVAASNLVHQIFPQMWGFLALLFAAVGILGLMVRRRWEYNYAADPTEIRKENLEGKPVRLFLIAIVFLVLYWVAHQI